MNDEYSISRENGRYQLMINDNYYKTYESFSDAVREIEKIKQRKEKRAANELKNN